MNLAHLDWPFFDPLHRTLAERAVRFDCNVALREDDVGRRCRSLVSALGESGLLRYCVPESHGGALRALDSRALCVVREALAYRDGLADFAFAMQGLGSGAITLAGSDAQCANWLPKIASGEAIAAFALSEPEAGSDAAALSATALRDRDGWVLNGCKTWISNGGIADFYCVFARTGTETGSRGISAFVVPANAAGLTISERIELIAPHPIARMDLRNCRVTSDARLGSEGDGFKLAMQTLDIFRASVGAAALGFARRALDESISHAQSRRMFGATLADRELTQATLGDMATAIDAAALLVYRAAWMRDARGARTTREAAMAKLTATESAQRVIDAAVQLHGGLGVTKGSTVERLYREIRALRIYEGASEVQRLIIGRDVLKKTLQAEKPR
jgi:alkylation response protein AidB-like acyl-CoA dehydrogenase